MKPPIPYEEIARFPLPGTAVPVSLGFGPGDGVLTYVHSPDLGLDRRLYVLDLDSSRADGDEGSGAATTEAREVPLDNAARSEDELTLEERLRRERAREVGLGVTSATWAESAGVLMVPLPDGIWVLRGLAEFARDRSGQVRVDRRLAVGSGGDGAAAIEDPRLSPDGSKVAFVRAGDLYVATTGATEPQPPLRLTFTAEEGLSNGLAEYVAQEEMDRAHGCWWSPDGSRIAYTEVDERHIPSYRIPHPGSDGPNGGTYEEHRYPFAGAENARLRLGVLPADGGETVWMKFRPSGGDVAEEYLARVDWLPDGGLAAQVVSRDQRHLDLYRFDVATGDGVILHRETGDPWVRLHDDFRPLGKGGELTGFCWSSERSGWRHVEVRNADGSFRHLLTSGEWAIDKLEAVDEERGLVFFTAARDETTEKHLYSVPLGGGELRRLTAEAGVHEVVCGRAKSVFVDTHSSLVSPPSLMLRSLDAGHALRPIYVGADPRVSELDLDPPDLVSIPAADGTELNGLVFRAQEVGGRSDPPPLVVTVYGGPSVQLVQNSWRSTVMLRSQALARLGCTVLVADGRGSARRGLAFEAPIRHLTGHVEVADQVAAVRWAVAEGLADAARVAVNGWSYGGYMSLMCLARAPDTFRAAVAGAPVTHWDGYDTFYTERYMGTPEENPEGYERSSVLAHARDIRGKLLLVHGLVDENVHFRHTARLINRLVANRVTHSLLLFPDERHLPRRADDRAYLEQTVVSWLLEAVS